MEGPGGGSLRVGAAGGLGTRCPQRSPSTLSPGLPERLELEKKRSRQSLEDSENLRFKEVPHWGASSGPSLPLLSTPGLQTPQRGLVSSKHTPGQAPLAGLGVLHGGPTHLTRF